MRRSSNSTNTILKELEVLFAVVLLLVQTLLKKSRRCFVCSFQASVHNINVWNLFKHYLNTLGTFVQKKKKKKIRIEKKSFIKIIWFVKG